MGVIFIMALSEADPKTISIEGISDHRRLQGHDFITNQLKHKKLDTSIEFFEIILTRYS
jgi:hypothetical protein